MYSFKIFPIILLVLFCYVNVSSGFKITRFEVPSEVPEGSMVELRCEYEIMIPYNKLYTLRWLKNNVEFYRYDPQMEPKHNFYLRHGLHVNTRKSNGTIMYINHASEEDTQGLYTCEVTTFPHFQRIHESQSLTVVSHISNALELKDGIKRSGNLKNSSPNSTQFYLPLLSILSIFISLSIGSTIV